MNARTLVVGVLAVVCGLSAMFLVQAMRKPPSGPVIEKVSVVFVAAEVKPGETIQEAMLEAREVPKSEVPEDAVLKIADAIDRAAMTQLDKGDLLREKKLAERGAGRGMAALIKTGMRAITIPTPSYSTSMAGFLLPGNHVDVQLTTSSSGGSGDESGGATTTTLLENVKILGVDTTVNTPSANKIDPEKARSVTVEVTPEDVNRIQLAQSKGTLHLALRNQRDDKAASARPANLADIQVIVPRAVPPPVVPQPAAAPPVVKALDRDLAPLIPRGMRAFTIFTTSHAESLVKTIRVGHRVDVLVTLKSKKAQASDSKKDKADDPKKEQANEQEQDQGISTTLLQDQEVLDIHPTIEPNANQGGSDEEVRAITLLVTPRDAELLDLAEDTGKIHLSLRPEDAGDDPKPDPVTFADLLGDRKANDLLGDQKSAEPAFRMVSVQVLTLRGTVAGANTFTYAVPTATLAKEANARSRRAPAP
jgi:pilus assembly protein CpaB